ncbi:MAG: hypothetical protein HZC01_01230 [Candidatus Kerfeldbacteria bacterium]|nr:hypothetical protein [Candidatus Kerfeldbacteria bacterium]
MTRRINTIHPFIAGALLIVVSAAIYLLWVASVKAVWNPPSAQPPAGNVYAPLNTSRDSQAKRGWLLLDPYYNPYGELPSFMYPLEVRGTRDVFINNFEVAPAGTLQVDTDTLYVDGNTHRVGIGLNDPATLLELDGGLLIGTQSAGVTGSALVTSSALNYGALGTTQQDGQAAVRGIGTAGPGVYGLNTSSGTGIRADSLASSAVVGSSNAALDRAAAIKRAGVYGQATGVGAWAGYFAQQVYSSQESYARGFMPNRLQNSQFPYTAGQELRDLASSKIVDPSVMLFDGTWIWQLIGESWDNSPYFLLLDPSNGAISEEFILENSSGTQAHGTSEMILGGGYIWVANNWDDALGISRVDPNDPTHTATHYAVGAHASASDDGPTDLIYDPYTIGGPYIWTINDAGLSRDYSISRFRIADQTYTNFKLAPNTGDQCLSYDPKRCSDRLDNDGDGNIDSGICSNASYTTQATCQANGGTWTPGDTECINQTQAPGTSPTGAYPAGDERLVMASVNAIHGITLQPNTTDPSSPTIWVAFDGLDSMTPTLLYRGEGIAKFSAADPTNTALQKVYCPGPASEPHALAWGDGKVWIGKSSHYSKYQGNEGLASFNPTTETFTNYASVTTNLEKVEYDDTSSGGPYVWAHNYYDFFKINTTGTIVHSYEVPDGMADFDFDRESGPVDYVWGSHGVASSISRNMIDAPYTTITYIPKGSFSQDTLYDGTYLWSSNNAGNTISKYRASDGQKVGDYFSGYYPSYLAFDGQSIWVTHGSAGGSNTELAQIRASDGVLIGDYDYTTSSNEDGNDMIFDGQYLWISDDSTNTLKRIDPISCSGSNCTASSFAVANGPKYLAFDGEYIWVTRKTATSAGRNSYSKIDRTTGAILSTYAISTAYNVDDNLYSILFDGTYLWFGARNRDTDGNSVYKVRISDGSVAARIPTMNIPGRCSGGTRANLFCTATSQCTGGGTCSATANNVSALTFDGTHIWAVQERANYTRECEDGIDNDGNGQCDRGCGALPADTKCASVDDAHETDSSDYYGTTTDIECADRVDNDGNGLCDYDGAPGSPGCSGRPDPECSSASDIDESVRENAAYLNRINAGTSQYLDGTQYGYYCNPNSLTFDGSSIWVNQTTNNCDGYNLHQFFSGTGFSHPDLEGLANLQTTIPGRNQAGSIFSSGQASIGRELIVTNDFQVIANVWGGSSDDVRGFSTSCQDGQFAKGFDITTNSLHCRPL